MQKPQTSGKRLWLNLTPSLGERPQVTRVIYPPLLFHVNPVAAQTPKEYDMRRSNRQPSRRLTESDARDIKRRLRRGDMQSRIAADYDVNIGRISEINTGKKFASVK